jgi:predicted ArsR family transcriptional regulator
VTSRGAVGQLRQRVRTRTGHHSPLERTEFDLLAQVDRQRTVAEIARLAGVPVADATVAFERLQNRGLVAFQLHGARQQQPAGRVRPAADSQPQA